MILANKHFLSLSHLPIYAPSWSGRELFEHPSYAETAGPYVPIWPVLQRWCRRQAALGTPLQPVTPSSVHGEIRRELLLSAARWQAGRARGANTITRTTQHAPQSVVGRLVLSKRVVAFGELTRQSQLGLCQLVLDWLSSCRPGFQWRPHRFVALVAPGRLVGKHRDPLHQNCERRTLF